ncbi:MAG: BREX-1 system adenine-specific DNA-methyltransferase PglX [Eubacteriales bacterium]|nr:BREX-1 system adenine-specific DNA-methyltransferase PglX [Eubacteriales bacterium]
MLKRAVKDFAQRAQHELIEEIKQSASDLGINPSGISAKSDTLSTASDVLGLRRKQQRADLIAAIRQQEEIEKDYLSAYRTVLSAAAYKCFSAVIALRFLELNDFLPALVPALSELEPEPQSYLLDLSPAEKEIWQLQREQSTDSAHTFLFLKKCHSLADLFPSVFADIPDYLELLLQLSPEKGLLRHLCHDIPEADFDLRQRAQVEILGWFYQEYRSERRDEIIKLNVKKIKKADIPAATQVFTPDWIVQYLLDNSLGRYWLERNPESALREKLEFFVEAKSEEQTTKSDVHTELIAPQDLTLLDPCVGSGHILLYAFDLLLEIYRECGYSEPEAARQIVRHNLHGLDIDENVVRLADFALRMKARSYDPDFFTYEVETQIHCLDESNGLEQSCLSHIKKLAPAAAETGEYLLTIFRETREIGSIIQVEERDYESFLQELDQAAASSNPCSPETKLLKALAQQAQILSRKYCVVCTNPPYMNRFTGKLRTFVKKNYSDYGRDLFSVYIYRNFFFCQPDGYSALLTPYVWMFIKSYEKLRRYLIREKTITTLVQLEYSAFDAAMVPLCAFVLKNAAAEGKGLYIKLSEFAGGLQIQEEKLRQALAAAECSYFYECAAENFCKLPSSPIAYWANQEVFRIFEKGTPMKNVVEARQGIASGDNARFLRLWFEVEENKINFNATSVADFHQSGKLYAPHNKGGRYRRWYGNYDYVIKFDQENFAALAAMGNCLPSRQFYFREAISWSLITSAGFSIRYRKSGSVPNVAGNSAFSADPDLLKYLLALLSTPIADYLFKMMNPTLNLNIGDFDNFPVLLIEERREDILQLATDCVNLAKSDWDSFETSRDFTVDPLANFPAFQASYLGQLNLEQEQTEAKPQTLAEAYYQLKELFAWHFEQLKRKEEELNRRFIKLYGLEAELDPVPKAKDISSSLIFESALDVPEEFQGNRYILYRSDVIKQFISYAVGCLLGRYSLDETGLAQAGGEWDATKYTSFPPKSDNVLTLSDENYFADDIVTAFIDFVETIYGDEKLDENLAFIAAGLSRTFSSEQDPRSVIRRYFLRDFYKDHAQRYSVNGSGKRPIYWLFDSGKENAFKAFIYLHRYKTETVDLIREYLQRQLRRYEAELDDLKTLAQERLCIIPASERNRRQAKLERQISEAQAYDEKLQILAAERINLDLDDGVQTNYRRLQTADGKTSAILPEL